VFSPLRNARNSSGNAAVASPKFAVAVRSNQSMPLWTEISNRSATRCCFPSASMCHPSETNVRTAPGIAPGATENQAELGSRSGLGAERKPTSASRPSAAASASRSRWTMHSSPPDSSPENVTAWRGFLAGMLRPSYENERAARKGSPATALPDPVPSACAFSNLSSGPGFAMIWRRARSSGSSRRGTLGCAMRWARNARSSTVGIAIAFFLRSRLTRPNAPKCLRRPTRSGNTTQPSAATTSGSARSTTTSPRRRAPTTSVPEASSRRRILSTSSQGGSPSQVAGTSSASRAARTKKRPVATNAGSTTSAMVTGTETSVEKRRTGPW